MEGVFYDDYIICNFKLPIILLVKYKKKVLKDVIDEDIKDIMLKVSKVKGFSIELMESCPDRLAILLNLKGHHVPSEVLDQLMRISAFYIWKRHEGELVKYFKKERAFWSDDYLVYKGDESENSKKYFNIIGGTGFECMEEVPITNKQEYLKENYPYGSVPKLDDKKRCLHCDRDFTVGDYKVFRDKKRTEFICCPNSPTCDGTVIDWLPLKETFPLSLKKNNSS